MRRLRNWFGGILQLKCNSELRATSNRILERPGMQWQGESLNCQVILMTFYKPSVNHMAAAGGHLGGNNDHKQELWVTWLLLWAVRHLQKENEAQCSELCSSQDQKAGEQL